MTAILLAALTLLPVNESTYRQVLSAQKGQPILVNFWATWCGPCREEMPQLVAMQKRLGFKLLTISVDEPEKEAEARRFLEQHNVLPPAYLKRTDNDEKFISGVDPKWSGAVPALLLYDRGGKMARSFVGEPDLKAVEIAVRALLK